MSFKYGALKAPKATVIYATAPHQPPEPSLSAVSQNAALIVVDLTSIKVRNTTYSNIILITITR